MGNKTAIEWPDGCRVERAFDTLNRLSAIEEQGEALVEYDPIGRHRLAERRYANGATLAFHHQGELDGYDGKGRTVRMHHRMGADEVIDDFHYGFDAADNPLRSDLADSVLIAE